MSIKFYGSIRSMMNAIQSRQYKVYPADLYAYDSSGNRIFTDASGISTVCNTLSDTAIIDRTGRVYTYGNNASHRRWIQFFLTRAKMTTEVDASTLSLTDIRRIYPNDMAFAGLRLNGSVVVWGKYDYGANTSSVQSQLSGGVIYIHSTSDAQYLAGSFAALKNNGTVIVWGDSRIGGDVSGVTNLSRVIDIQSTGGAYAILREDGSVVAWGNPECGGEIPSSIQGDLTENVIQITSTQGAFAALLGDYRVVTWGDSNFGGDTSSIQSNLINIVDMTASPYTFTFIRADGTIYRVGYNAEKSYANTSGDMTSQPDILTTYHSIHSTALITGDIYRPIPSQVIYGSNVSPVTPFIYNHTNANPYTFVDLSQGKYTQIQIDASFQVLSVQDPSSGQYYNGGNTSPLSTINIVLYLLDNNGGTHTGTVVSNTIYNSSTDFWSSGDNPSSSLLSVNGISLIPSISNPTYPYTDLNDFSNNKLYVRIVPTLASGATLFSVRFSRLSIRTQYTVLETALEIDGNGNEPIYNDLLSKGDKITMLENIFYRNRINPPPNNYYVIPINDINYYVIYPAPVLDNSYNKLDSIFQSGDNILFPLRRGEIVKAYFGAEFQTGVGNVPIYRFFTFYNDTMYEIPILKDYDALNQLNDVLQKGYAPYDKVVYMKDASSAYYQNFSIDPTTRLFVPFKSFRVSPAGTNYSFSYIVDRNRFLLSGITVTPANQTGNEFIYQVTYVSSRGAPIRSPSILTNVPITGYPQKFVPVSERDTSTGDVYCILTGFRGVVARMNISVNNVSLENVVPLRLRITLPNVQNIFNTIYAYRLKDNGRDRYTGENGDIPPGYNTTNYPIPVIYDSVSDSWVFTLYSFSTYIFMTSAIPAGLTGGDPIVQPLRSINKRTVKLPNTWKRIILYKDPESQICVEAECDYLTYGMIRGMHSYRNSVERPYFSKTPDIENNPSDRKIYDYLRKNTFFSKIYLYRRNILETTIDLFDPYTNIATPMNDKWYKRIYPPKHEGVYSFGKRIYYPCSSQMHAYKVSLEKENYLYVYSDVNWDECTSIRLEMNKYEINRPIYSGELFEHSDEYLVATFSSEDASRVRS
jgi:hypothetical protein